MEKPIVSVFPESAKPKGANLRRHSTGKTIIRTSFSSPNSEEKLFPHYLRASTNSCHDFCKYGRKHAFEAKGKRIIPQQIRGNSETSTEGQSQVKNVNLRGERKKKLLIKINPTLEQNAAPAEGRKPIKCINLGDRNTKKVINLKSTSEQNTGLSDKPRTIKQKALSPSKKIEIYVKKPAIASKPKPVATKSLSPSSLYGGPSGRRNSENSLSNLSGNLSGGKNNEKNQFNRSGGLSGRRNSGSKIINNTSLSKIGERKSLKPPIVSLSPKPSLKPVKRWDVKAASPVKNQNKVRKSEPIGEKIKRRLESLNKVRKSEPNGEKNRGKSEPHGEKIIEKTLYVIEPKPENEILEPIQHEIRNTRSPPSSLFPSLSSSPSSSHALSSHEGEDGDEDSDTIVSESDFISEEDETEVKNQVDGSKDGDKRSLRRSAIIHPEDKDCVPQKLRFRRGKVVSLESENNGPRRLRFRQGRVVGENQNSKGDLGRRSFKKKESFGSYGTNPKTRAVMLRHQDVQGKKEEQGLFNDVIEETASKLVETRKSKVKALVGAFETVISLQESKPVTTG
ncbi:plant calmodulin-binding protein-like protein [Tasmannia lanceolata]|uniref:plant calmodulin-binding protein-like protein n=1 Tax=Tasmannia lanceolata TaxID=3420 RepID=UPI0040627CC5